MGYTAGGTRIEGYFLKPEDKQNGYEVHRIHNCARSQAEAAEAAKAKKLPTSDGYSSIGGGR